MEDILIILFLLIVFLFYRNDVYEYFHPNEHQYTVCASENKNEKGETNISINKNKLPIVQKGLYTSMIQHTDEKGDSRHFRTPSCSLMQELPLQTFYGNKIIDYDENARTPGINVITDKLVGSLDNYSILYPNIMNDAFIEQRKVLINSDDRF